MLSAMNCNGEFPLDKLKVAGLHDGFAGGKRCMTGKAGGVGQARDKKMTRWNERGCVWRNLCRRAEGSRGRQLTRSCALMVIRQ